MSDKRTSRRLKVERFPITSREQWMALRAGDVTASVVGALFGIHPYVTHMRIAVEKRDGLGTSQDETVAMHRGRILESAVAKLYQEKHPAHIIRKVEHYYRIPALRLGASPDYVMRDNEGRKAALQIKTVAPQVYQRGWTDETPPTWISLQTLVETMLLRADYGVIAVMIVDGYTFDMQEYVVPPHEGAWRRIQDGVAKFWSDLTAGKMPEFQPADRSLLAVMYPREQPGKIAELRGDNELPTLLDERMKLKDEIEEKIDRKETIETQLMGKMGDAEIADIPGWRVTYKQQHRKGYTVAETDYRVLRIAKDTAA